MRYDNIIVGGGPGGMTLATLLPGENLLIEREQSLGGCHRVRRVGSKFTEHGPRIYISNYVNAISMLKNIGIDYNDYFVPYNFQFLGIGVNNVMANLSFGEMMSLIKEYFILFVNPNHGSKITMKDWMKYNNFSKQSIEYIDRICLLTDGASIERYTLLEFLSLANQNTLYSTLQPKKPMDRGLIKDWGDKITCEIKLGTEVLEIKKSSIITNNGEFFAERIILAMPPIHVKQIVEKSNFKPFDKEWLQFAEQTKYITYIPVTLHFKNKLKLDKIWGLAKESKWGLVFIVLSDYMDENVISVAITKPDEIGYNMLTANQSTKKQIENEVVFQLAKLFKFKENPKAIMSPGVIRVGNVWETKDQAFVLTPKGYGSVKGKGEIYSISTHAGKSDYLFTSFETAVTNAIWLVNHLCGNKIKIKSSWSVLYILRMIFVFMILLLVAWLLKK